MMLILAFFNLSALLIIFIPVMICYFRISIVMANAAAVSMSYAADKAHGSSVMNFANVGFAHFILYRSMATCKLEKNPSGSR